MKKINVDGINFVPEDSQKPATSIDGMPPVLIRSYAAGVFFGYLEKKEPTVSGLIVTLRNARRVWYWAGAASLSQMANEGTKMPKECKISVSVPTQDVVNVIEILPLTEAAQTNLNGVPEWKQ